MKKHLLLAITFLFIVAGGIFYYYQNIMVANNITLDINPSIELVTNNSGKVIKFEALNDDGKLLLENTDLKKMSIESATDFILNKAIELEYIDTDSEDNAILVTVVGNNEEKQLKVANEIQVVIQEAAKNKNIDIEVINQGITDELKDQANEYGISNGKMMFITKMSEKYGLNIDEIASLSIKDIQLKIKAVKENPSVEKANDNSKVDMGDKEVRDAVKAEKKADQAKSKDEKQADKTVEE